MARAKRFRVRYVMRLTFTVEAASAGEALRAAEEGLRTWQGSHLVEVHASGSRRLGVMGVELEVDRPEALIERVVTEVTPAAEPAGRGDEPTTGELAEEGSPEADKPEYPR